MNDLIDHGLSYDDSLLLIKNNFDYLTVSYIFEKYNINPVYLLSITIPTPSNFHTNVTVNGTTGNIFHNNIDVTSTSISSNVSKANAIAKDLFGRTSYLYYYYFLYGEFSNSIGVHQGLDLQYTNNQTETFRTIVDGKVTVVQKDGYDNGRLGIYVSSENSTYIFAHASDYIDAITVGGTVSGNTYIGNQGNTGAAAYHVHVEVVSGEKTYGNNSYTQNTDGTYNLPLLSTSPYDKFYT